MAKKKAMRKIIAKTNVNLQQHNKQKEELNHTDKISKKHQLRKMLTLLFKSNKELSKPSSHRINLIIKKASLSSWIVMRFMPNWWKSSKKEKYFMPTWKKKIKISDQLWVQSNLRIKVLNRFKEAIWIMSTKIRTAINRM